MASSIVFSGLASGIDSEAIISALTQASKAPMTQLQNQKAGFNTQSKKLNDIKTKLSTLQTAAKALDTKTEALGNKVGTTDEKILKATGTGGAAMGSFKVEVTSVATAQRTYSEGFSADGEAGLAGEGTLTIQIGTGDAVEVEITADDTLATIAKKINASGAQVSAGIIKEGNNYRLQVTGRQTGAANVITFSETPGLTLGLAGATPKQDAADAKVLVDGFEFSSATNSVSNAVPGVTLNVVDKGISTVTVDRDGEGLKAKLNTFVTAYNDVMKTLNAEFAYTPGITKDRSSLVGDGTLHSLQAALRGALAEATDNGDSKLTTFGSIGLVAQRDGTLSLDDAKFTKAVTDDYEGIASALAGRADFGGLMTKISDAVDPYAKTDGTLRSKINNLTTRNRDIDRQINSMQTRLDKYEETLRRQYAALEQMISGLNSQGNQLVSIMSSM